jgi:hypothetical protein
VPLPVGPRGDLVALLTQQPADRLDPAAVRHLIGDNAMIQRLRGSRSPAKKAVAAFRMSLSSRNRQFSAFSRVVSADSSDVVPSRPLSSMSAWVTQRRTDSRATPSWRATATVAAVVEGYSLRCSGSSRTARSLGAGSIFFGMTPSSVTHKEAVQNLGRSRPHVTQLAE